MAVTIQHIASHLGKIMSNHEAKLPIDVVPNTRPPQFRWQQTVGTPIGPKVVDHEGALPPSIEDAVKTLIDITNRQVQEIGRLQQEIAVQRQTIENMAIQLDEQTEILKETSQDHLPTPTPLELRPNPSKKGK